MSTSAYPRRLVVLVPGLLVALTAAMALSLVSGAVQVPVRAVFAGRAAPEFELLTRIVWDLRFPRALTGMLVGASLGVSGAALQGLFRNPLADPYVLGVASGASFGTTVAWVLLGRLGPALVDLPFAPAASSMLSPLFAFAGALFAVVATVALSGSEEAHQDRSLVLAGVAVGSILTALSTYLLLRDSDRIRAVFAWSLGNLSFAGWQGLAAATPYAVVGLGLLVAFARPLDALQLGDATATTLGVDVKRARLAIITGASLATAAAVAFVGVVAFVGLVAPHAMRKIGPSDHRTLFVTSSLGGAVLLVWADLAARALTRPAELPVGIVTTLFGGPFFLWLLRRRS